MPSPLQLAVGQQPATNTSRSVHSVNHYPANTRGYRVTLTNNYESRGNLCNLFFAGFDSVLVRRELAISTPFETSGQPMLGSQRQQLLPVEQGVNWPKPVTSFRAWQRLPQAKHTNCARRGCGAVIEQSNFVVPWEYRLQHRAIRLYLKLGVAEYAQDDQRSDLIWRRALHHFWAARAQVYRLGVRVRDKPGPQTAWEPS